MTFWLARERRAQESTFMQRFDPRFWTVNFPRPAMASVVTIGPDALRVDVELHHEGELVGLIWDSADTLDHPLLAYETDRDYSHTSLRFRWQSEGIIPLDQPNGPTLTIEGRDASGAPRTWYVRLWNYAEGTPSDAVITLPFSTLEDGYSLPGEPIYPADIDRMFISLVAPGYTPGSTAPLAARFNGSATMSRIVADGGRAILELGDVLLPPHGERMASAFDDAYNQTPARLLRAVVGLGYRDDLVHYVGMSHFMRLERQPDDALVVSQTGQLSAPASAWHENYFALARADELEVIASLSYELFDAYCPEAWKQRTASGAPALTGWVPPSTLLSPANGEAMNWLADCARAFVDLLEQTGLPVRFQIGEPWWWVTGNGEICLYDAAARAAFGGQPPVITDMRAPLGTEASALLDAAGALLAQSTTALTAAVRQRHRRRPKVKRHLLGDGTAEVEPTHHLGTSIAGSSIAPSSLRLGRTGPLRSAAKLEGCHDWSVRRGRACPLKERWARCCLRHWGDRGCRCCDALRPNQEYSRFVLIRPERRGLLDSELPP